MPLKEIPHHEKPIPQPPPLNPLNTVFRRQTLSQRKASNTLIYLSSYINPKNSAAPTTNIAGANEQTHQIKQDYQKAIF
jgi:hypothetical protein